MCCVALAIGVMAQGSTPSGCILCFPGQIRFESNHSKAAVSPMRTAAFFMFIFFDLRDTDKKGDAGQIELVPCPIGVKKLFPNSAPA
jgi:hypothetical protein